MEQDCAGGEGCKSNHPQRSQLLRWLLQQVMQQVKGKECEQQISSSQQQQARVFIKEQHTFTDANSQSRKKEISIRRSGYDSSYSGYDSPEDESSSSSNDDSSSESGRDTCSGRSCSVPIKQVNSHVRFSSRRNSNRSCISLDSVETSREAQRGRLRHLRWQQQQQQQEQQQQQQAAREDQQQEQPLEEKQQQEDEEEVMAGSKYDGDCLGGSATPQQPAGTPNRLDVDLHAAAEPCSTCLKLQQQLFVQQVRLACAELECKRLLQGVAQELHAMKKERSEVLLQLHREKQQQQQQQQVIAALQQEVVNQKKQLQALQQLRKEGHAMEQLIKDTVQKKQQQQQKQKQQEGERVQLVVTRRNIRGKVQELLQQLQQRQARWCGSLLLAADKKQQQLLLRLKSFQTLLQQQQQQQQSQQQSQQRRQLQQQQQQQAQQHQQQEEQQQQADGSFCPSLHAFSEILVQQHEEPQQQRQKGKGNMNSSEWDEVGVSSLQHQQQLSKGMHDSSQQLGTPGGAATAGDKSAANVEKNQTYKRSQCCCCSPTLLDIPFGTPAATATSSRVAASTEASPHVKTMSFTANTAAAAARGVWGTCCWSGITNEGPVSGVAAAVTAAEMLRSTPSEALRAVLRSNAAAAAAGSAETTESSLLPQAQEEGEQEGGGVASRAAAATTSPRAPASAAAAGAVPVVVAFRGCPGTVKSTLQNTTTPCSHSDICPMSQQQVYEQLLQEQQKPRPAYLALQHQHLTLQQSLPRRSVVAASEPVCCSAFAELRGCSRSSSASVSVAEETPNRFLSSSAAGGGFAARQAPSNHHSLVLQQKSSPAAAAAGTERGAFAAAAAASAAPIKAKTSSADACFSTCSRTAEALPSYGGGNAETKRTEGTGSTSAHTATTAAARAKQQHGCSTNSKEASQNQQQQKTIANRCCTYPNEKLIHQECCAVVAQHNALTANATQTTHTPLLQPQPHPIRLHQLQQQLQQQHSGLQQQHSEQQQQQQCSGRQQQPSKLQQVSGLQQQQQHAEQQEAQFTCERHKGQDVLPQKRYEHRLLQQVEQLQEVQQPHSQRQWQLYASSKSFAGDSSLKEENQHISDTPYCSADDVATSALAVGDESQLQKDTKCPRCCCAVAAASDSSVAQGRDLRLSLPSITCCEPQQQQMMLADDSKDQDRSMGGISRRTTHSSSTRDNTPSICNGSNSSSIHNSGSCSSVSATRNSTRDSDSNATATTSSKAVPVGERETASIAPTTTSRLQPCCCADTCVFSMAQQVQLHQQQSFMHPQQQCEQTAVEQHIHSHALKHELGLRNEEVCLQRVTIPQQHSYVLQQQDILRPQQALLLQQQQLYDEAQGLELTCPQEVRRPSSLLSQASVARGGTPRSLRNNAIVHLSPVLSIQSDCLAVHQHQQQQDYSLFPQRQQEGGSGPQQQQHLREACFLLPQERSLFPRVLPLQPQEERLLIMQQEQQDEHLLLMQCAHERSIQRSSSAAGAGTGEAPILAAAASKLLHKCTALDNSAKQEASDSKKDNVAAAVF